MTEFSTLKPSTVLLKQLDRDGDGISDEAEQRRLGTNLNAADSDQDGIPDGIEYNMRLNPRSPDTDGDDITDGFDQQPFNAQQIVIDIAHQLGTGQGEHYAIVVKDGLLQISALDGRPGLNGQGLIFYQYANETISQLRQTDLDRFAQVHHQLINQPEIQTEQLELG
jgi:hypothetical protein